MFHHCWVSKSFCRRALECESTMVSTAPKMFYLWWVSQKFLPNERKSTMVSTSPKCHKSFCQLAIEAISPMFQCILNSAIPPCARVFFIILHQIVPDLSWANSRLKHECSVGCSMLGWEMEIEISEPAANKKMHLFTIGSQHIIRAESIYNWFTIWESFIILITCQS